MNKQEVKLRDCPPGPFLFNGSLGFKTEYGSMECENPRDPKTLWRVGHHSDVYVLASGEAFWGGVTSKEDREELLVVPVEAGALALSALPERELWIGDMMIRHAPNGIWIGRRGGEGGEFATEHVERVIAQFYREQF